MEGYAIEHFSLTHGVVQNGALVYEQDGQQVSIIVGTPAWYSWLEMATSFTFACEVGSFTAHKARAGNRRGGWYWRAYHRQKGRLSRWYLGISAKVTLSSLYEAAYQLAARAESTSQSRAAVEYRQPTSPEARPPLLILPTKCALPRLPVQHVPRRHLVALLEQGAVGPLTVVSAPAGSGKTTLLAEWAQSTPMPVTWLSLETADSDPARFLAYLLAALRTLDEHLGRQTEAMLATKPVHHHETALCALVNELATSLATESALVLDDAHLLESTSVQQLLLFLLEHLPPRLHVILGTRVDPAFPLARWRVQGHLSEVRAEHLRFTTPEVRAFLQQMHLDLAEDLLNMLEQRTEGWVAGVQLAALALRGREDHRAFLSGFHGNHQFIQEYVGEEILAGQPLPVRDFLLQTSILERLHASLCDAVTANTGSQAMLESLRKANLFVSALDETSTWYRYHALFVEGLRHHLLQHEPERFSLLCARASAWYEAHEQFFEACEYALQARDYPRAAPLIERQMSKLIGQMQFPLLRRWMAQVPPDIIASRPSLGVASAWVSLFEDDQSEHLVQQIAQLEQQFQTYPAADQTQQIVAYAHLHFIRLLQAIGDNNAEGALEIARQTLQALPEAAAALRSLAWVCLKLAQATAHRASGEYAAAERVLLEAVTQSQATGMHLLHTAAGAMLGELYEAQGELPKLAQLYERLLQGTRASREAPTELVFWVYMNKAKLLLEWNSLDEVEECLQLVLETEQWTQLKDHALGCLLVQVWISQARARGQDEKTLEVLQKLERDLARHCPTPVITEFDGLWRARQLLNQGKLDEAARQLHVYQVSTADPFTGRPENHVFFAKYATLARVLIAQGRRSPKAPYLAQALGLLERFSAAYQLAGCTGRVIELLILTALALQAQNKTLSALAVLGRAASLAEPAGYVRLFADEGQPMAQLLAQVTAYTSASPRYLQRLQAAALSTQQAELALMPGVPLQPLIDPLSAREQEVLALLAAGASNQQIADRLVISVNTAKRHVKHLLAKLAATNRTQAVAHARELHLL